MCESICADLCLVATKLHTRVEGADTVSGDEADRPTEDKKEKTKMEVMNDRFGQKEGREGGRQAKRKAWRENRPRGKRWQIFKKAFFLLNFFF